MPSSTGQPEVSQSLYAIGVQLQAISAEIAEASELLLDEDPELQAEGVALLERYLAVEESTKGALADKADRLLGFADHLIAQAAFRKQQAKRLTELAKRDEAKVARLHEYLIKVLTTISPEETGFSFPTHELTSRRSEDVVVSDDIEPLKDLEPDLVRATLSIKTDLARVNDLLALILAPAPDADASTNTCVLPEGKQLQESEYKLEGEASKSAIKAAIKAGRKVPGCEVRKKRNWTVK